MSMHEHSEDSVRSAAGLSGVSLLTAVTQILSNAMQCNAMVAVSLSYPAVKVMQLV
jgi:hypothetical protein